MGWDGMLMVFIGFQFKYIYNYMLLRFALLLPILLAILPHNFVSPWIGKEYVPVHILLKRWYIQILYRDSRWCCICMVMGTLLYYILLLQPQWTEQGETAEQHPSICIIMIALKKLHVHLSITRMYIHCCLVYFDFINKYISIYYSLALLVRRW